MHLIATEDRFRFRRCLYPLEKSRFITSFAWFPDASPRRPFDNKQASDSLAKWQRIVAPYLDSGALQTQYFTYFDLWASIPSVDMLVGVVTIDVKWSNPATCQWTPAKWHEVGFQCT